MPYGSTEDEEDVYGLAHLAEQALVRGSRKYPQVGGFDKFLAGHGGAFNAYTDAERTVFYFSMPGCDAVVWGEALDRFAAFLEAPLLEGWEQEIDAIDDEFATQRSDPSRRLWDLVREIAFGTSHPFGRFWTGNHQSLGSRSRADVERMLRRHIERFFCASSLKLVLSGSFKTLEDMESLILQNFQSLSLCETSAPAIINAVLPSVGRVVKAEVHMPPELWLWLPLPKLQPQRLAQPAHFLKYMLRDEAPGGLVSMLTRQERLVSSMVPGVDSFRETAWLYLRMGLTPLGNEDPQRVLDIVASYFKKLQMFDSAELHELYKSFVAALSLSFDFPAHRTMGAEFAVSILEGWSEVETDCDVFAASGGLASRPNVTFIAEILESLNPDFAAHANILHASRTPCGAACRVQTNYGTPYRFVHPYRWRSQLSRAPALPSPVRCGLHTSRHEPESDGVIERPRRVHFKNTVPGVEAWWRTDFAGNLQESPRFSLRVRIEGQPVQVAEDEAVALVRAEAVREELKAKILPLLGGELCGLQVTVHRTAVAAWEIVAEGLGTFMIPDLLLEVAATLRHPLGSYPPGLLHAWQRRALSRLVDRSDAMAFDVATEAVSEIAMFQSWTRADLVKALEALSGVDFSRTDISPFQGAVVYMVAPSLSQDHAQEAGHSLATGLGFVDPTLRFGRKLEAMPYIAKVPTVVHFGHADVSMPNPINNDISSAAVVSHFIATASVEEEILTQLLTRILDDRFSRELRFEAKDAAAAAGYIVACNSRRPTPGVVELRLIAQGTKSSSELRSLLLAASSRASEFLEGMVARLNKDDELELRQLADSLIAGLSSPPMDLVAVADRDWSELWTARHCFGRRGQAVTYLRQSTQSLADGVLRMWARARSSDTAIVEVGSGAVKVDPGDTLTDLSADANFTHSVAVPLRREVLERELWEGRHIFPTFLTCSVEDNAPVEDTRLTFSFW